MKRRGPRNPPALGERFGKWTVTGEPFTRRDSGSYHVPARCDCGATGAPRIYNLQHGLSRQCKACGSALSTCPDGSWATRYAVGTEHGRWTVIAERKAGSRDIQCRCRCGTVSDVAIGNLHTGMSTGCARCAETGVNVTHGMSKSSEYRIYQGMTRRCTDPNHVDWERYGGRGIKVADEWLGEGGFERWYEYIGPRPSGRHSIDRIDNDGDYRPGNVRWATFAEQARNTSRSRLLRVGSELLTMKEAGARLGISRQAIRQRLNAGWTPIEAATTPKGEKPPSLRARRREERRRLRAADGNTERGDKRVYRCGLCGEDGHQRRTCKSHETHTLEVA